MSIRTWRGIRRTMAAGLVVGAVASGAIRAGVSAATGSDAVAACRAGIGAAPELGPSACRSVEQLVWNAAAWCRFPLRSAGDASAPEACQAVDGRVVSDASVVRYQQSWVHDALRLQRGLGEGAALWDAQIVHTHNSFNSSAYRIPDSARAPSYAPTLTNQDPNQVLSLTDQLDLDVRFLELDLHWVPSPYGNAATGGMWVTLCHGNSGLIAGVHVGCTADRPFEDGLAEIGAWLDRHPGEFVFLYLENQLGGSARAHELAAQLIRDAFPAPEVVATPTAEPCASLPFDATERDLRATGARVLITGNCDAANGAATGWGGVVHDRGSKWLEDGDGTQYGPAQCAADRAARAGHANFRRWYGDSTWLTAMVSHGTNLAAATVAQMVACGVNIIGLDQLTADDDRLAALVWSWAPEEASNPSGDCAGQRGSDAPSSGRLAGAPCGATHRFACRDGDGAWNVTAAAGAWGDGFATCASEFAGSRFAAPANGLQNTLISSARLEPAGLVWINDRAVGGTWQVNAAGP